jgi:hypothetical protein
MHLIGEDFARRTSKRRYCFENLRAMYLVTRRLVYPARSYDIATNSGRGAPFCSEVINETIAYLFARWHGSINWWPAFNHSQNLQDFADAYGHGCCGDVDGTFVPIQRPSDPWVRHWTYSGYYRLDGIKFQCIVGPHGMVVAMYDPCFGPVNDFAIWDRSGVPERLREILGE